MSPRNVTLHNNKFCTSNGGMYVHSSYRYLTLVLERELSSSTYQHTYSTYLALVPKVDDLGLSHTIHLPIYLLAYLPLVTFLLSNFFTIN